MMMQAAISALVFVLATGAANEDGSCEADSGSDCKTCWCGETWEDAAKNCYLPCPDREDAICSKNGFGHCYRDITCSAPDPPITNYLGAFFICYGTCDSDKMKFMPPVPSASLNSAGICFGGGTDPDLNRVCFPDNGCVLDGSARNTLNFVKANNKWYSIGGGGKDEKTYMGANILRFYPRAEFEKLKNAGYNGIFYDIEAFAADATLKVFQQSFKLAKDLGMMVAISTSYSAPWNTAPIGGVQASDALWRKLIKDSNVDLILPQFYGDDGEKAIIVKTWSSEVTLEEYKDLTTPIAPIFKVNSMGFFENQVDEIQKKCKDSSLPKNFCSTGYYAWPSS